MPDLEVRLGKQRLSLPIERRTVILCDDAAQATRVLDGLAAAGVAVASSSDAPRGRVAEQLPKAAGPDGVRHLLHELRLDEDLLEWKPRELGPLQRVIASSVVASAGGAQIIAFDVAALAASPFDVAHVCGHIRRASESLAVTTIAVIADAGLISSAGTHLVVLDGETLGEAGPVSAVLARPSTSALERRLEATPIASPLAMQMRRVQRTATTPVDYAHTTIIALPTQESIALAGGDE